MKPLLFSILILSVSLTHAATFKVECRDDSPEIIVTSAGCLGPVAEIVQTALSRQGHKIKWVPNDWQTSLAAAKNGDVDMLIRHSMDEERSTFLSAVPFGYDIYKIHYFAGASVNKRIYVIDDLTGFTVGAKQDTFYSDAFASNNKIKKVLYPEYELLERALETGEVDVAITSKAHDMDAFQRMSSASITPYYEKLNNGRYISIAKNSKMIRYFDDINEEITKMVSDGEIAEIYKRYGIKPPEQLKR